MKWVSLFVLFLLFVYPMQTFGVHLYQEFLSKKLNRYTYFSVSGLWQLHPHDVKGLSKELVAMVETGKVGIEEKTDTGETLLKRAENIDNTATYGSLFPALVPLFKQADKKWKDAQKK